MCCPLPAAGGHFLRLTDRGLCTFLCPGCPLGCSDFHPVCWPRCHPACLEHCAHLNGHPCLTLLSSVSATSFCPICHEVTLSGNLPSCGLTFQSVSAYVRMLVNTVVYLLIFKSHSFSGQWELTLPSQYKLSQVNDTYIDLTISLDFKSHLSN